jgi:NAD(P)-dependent dehydrogenase (short-subunit alcohol dehydrogenase family)
MAKTHEGRVALVTGAAQGIGQAIALALAQRGAQVIATDLAIPQETVKLLGKAGYFPNQPIDELDYTTWRRTLTTNLDSHFLSVKSFLPDMRNDWASLRILQAPSCSSQVTMPLLLLVNHWLWTEVNTGLGNQKK